MKWFVQLSGHALKYMPSTTIRQRKTGSHLRACRASYTLVFLPLHFYVTRWFRRVAGSNSAVKWDTTRINCDMCEPWVLFLLFGTLSDLLPSVWSWPGTHVYGCARVLWLGLSFGRVAGMVFLSQDHETGPSEWWWQWFWALTVTCSVTHRLNSGLGLLWIPCQPLGMSYMWAFASAFVHLCSYCNAVYVCNTQGQWRQQQMSFILCPPIAGIQDGHFPPSTGSGTTCQAVLWE